MTSKTGRGTRSTEIEKAIEFYRLHGGSEGKEIYWTIAMLIKHCGSFKDAEKAVLGLRYLIMEYGGHTAECSFHLACLVKGTCDCGWEAIEKALK